MLIGIVGKPSVGKSTFFAAATSAPVEISERPFTTIKPNHAVGYVKIECVDRELGVQCNPRSGFCKEGFRFIPVELMDVAGLVPGAHQGKGLGNRFLDDLRKADVLIHVIDASGSTDAEGRKVPLGSYDPANDVVFLEEELYLWVKGILEKNWKKISRDAKGKGLEQALLPVLSGFGLKNSEEIAKEFDGMDESRIPDLAKKIISEKPIIIAANKCDKPNKIDDLKKRFPDKLIIPCSAEAELSLKTAAKNGFIDYIPGDSKFTVKKQLTEEQKAALDILSKTLESCGGTGVQQVLNAAVFEVLKYIAVYPGGVSKLADKDGNVLPDVFLLPPNSTALDFAHSIHSDVAKGFIKAIDVRTKRAVGKDYKLKHRDIIEVVFR